MIRAALALALALPAAHAALPVHPPGQWVHVNRQPYIGTVRQALASFHLPRDVQSRLADRIERGDSDGRVWFTRHGIQADDGIVYAPEFLMTSGRHVALSRVGFEPTRSEPAERYTDGVYTVAVPIACGNVSLLHAAGYPGATPPQTVLPDAGALDSYGWNGWHVPHAFGAPGAFYSVPHGYGPWQVPAVPPVHIGPGPHGPVPLVPAIPVSVPGTALLVAAGVAAALYRRQA